MDKKELLEQLKSTDHDKIRDAILHLENCNDLDVVRAIVDTILHVKSKKVLTAGLETLLNCANKEAVAKEAIALIFSKSPKIRHAGITIIVSCGEVAIEIVKEKLLCSDDFNIRKHALDILKDIKTEKSLELISSLLKDENPNVKYSAVEFLMEFTQFKDKVVEILLDFIKNEKFDSLYGATSIASTIIYGHFFDKRFIPLLRKKLENISDEHIKHWIYKILIYLGDEDIIPEAKENAKKIDMLNVIENDITIAKLA